jgi:hypothetical protein
MRAESGEVESKVQTKEEGKGSSINLPDVPTMPILPAPPTSDINTNKANSTRNEELVA